MSAISSLTGPVIISVASVAGLIALKNADFHSVLELPFRDGTTQIELEEKLNQAVPIRDISIAAWNSLRYGLFNEMLEGGVAGKDGWLFSAEEYRVVPNYDVELRRSLDEVVDHVETLQKIGIDVVVALIPDKARIAADKLKFSRPSNIEMRYDASISSLRLAGVNVVDLRPALASIPDYAAFLKQDTHWTANGAKAAAKCISQKISERGTEEFITTQSDSKAYNSDLVRFIAPGKFANKLGLTPFNIPLFVTSKVQDVSSENDLFDDQTNIPVALVGTSYSALAEWNFVGFLQEMLHMDVRNHSFKGRGPFEPMKHFLDNISSDAHPKLVIWEIPERYLTITP